MSTTTIQVLDAARLAKDAGESTWTERRSSGTDGWAKVRSDTLAGGYRVVRISEDSAVPRAASAFDRAGSGPVPA